MRDVSTCPFAVFDMDSVPFLQHLILIIVIYIRYRNDSHDDVTLLLILGDGAGGNKEYVYSFSNPFNFVIHNPTKSELDF